MKTFQWIIILLAVTSLAGCPDDGNSSFPTPQPQSGWSIGPIANGKNYSQGMPAYPTPEGAGWRINMPGPGGGVDAVIKHDPPSLVGATALTMNYTVTGGGFLATEQVNVPGRVGICLQRRGDDWSGKGAYQQYRLYGQSRPLLVAGDGVLTVPLLAGTMTDVYGQPASQATIDAVIANLDNVAVVFGGSFASHGVYATQPSEFHMVTLDPVR